MKCLRCGGQLVGEYFRVWDNVDKFFLENEFLCPACFSLERVMWAQCPVCFSWVPAEMVDQCCFYRKRKAG